MKKNIKCGDPIFPMPVLMVATYNDDRTVNVLNAAWGTVVDMGIIAVNLAADHHTTENIKKRGAFTVSIADAAHVTEADYFGVESGKNVSDKLSRAGMTAVKSENIDAPIINEFPVCVECEFIEFQSNTYGVGVIGKVVNVSVEEDVMTNGKVDVAKLNAIAFDPFTRGYYKVTERVGNAFGDGLKLKNKN